MPRLIVLVCADDAEVRALAEQVAAGARTVRFSEVDVRSVPSLATSPGGRQALGSAGQVSEYAGVAIVCGKERDAGHVLLQELGGQPAGTFENTVFAVIGATEPATTAQAAGLGGILVSANVSGGAAEAAAAVGARLAKVVEWVRHALSHEQSHQHDHGHHHHAHGDSGQRHEH